MATIDTYRAQVRLKEADWRVGPIRRFRWSRFRFEHGYWCHVVHPVEGCRDRRWWEWEIK